MEWRRLLRVVSIAGLVVLSGALAGVALSPSSPFFSHLTATSASVTAAVLPNPQVIRAPPAGYAEQLAREFAASGAPADVFLPPNPGSLPGYRNGVITHPAYSDGPEPVGVADYGVLNTTGTPTSYTIDSTGYMGSLTLDSDSEFSLPGTGYPEVMSIQMNAVLDDVTVNGLTGYQFWTQNVLVYDGYSHTGQLLDNLWNFSASPEGTVTPADIYSGNGTVVAPEFYYDLGSKVLSLPTPFTIQFYLNASTTTIGGVPHTEVAYAYNIFNPTTHAKIAGDTYDNVVFNNQGDAAIPQAEYHVDGTNLTGTGYIPFDAELIVGGNTGGSTGSFNNFAGTMTLEHLNAAGTEYVPEPSTWNAGSESGETVEGIASYYDSTDVVHLGPGPSFTAPFWNSSPTAAPGAAVLSGMLTPANGFAFVTNSVTYSATTSTWAPVRASGVFEWNLTGGTYTARFLASEYNPLATGPIVVASGTTAPPIAATLTANASIGVYTPLYAANNAELKAISSAGSGTLAAPYVLDNDEPGALSPEFGDVNDYFYPVFTGILLNGTTDYVEVANAAPFLVDYQGYQLQFANYFGLPSSNNLGIEMFGASHVSVVGGTLLGWVGYYQSQSVDETAYAALVVWNSTSILITGATFEDEGYGITLYGGTNNTITGNLFVDDPVTINAGYGTYPIYGGLDGPGPTGIVTYEAGDLIFNNEFNTYFTAVESDVNFYDGLYASYKEAFLDNWNLSAAVPANTAFTYNGVTVSGSVTGAATVCGNYWWNEAPTSPVPYNNDGYIANGGDYCGTGPALYLVPFTESGLPVGASWGFEIVPLPPETLPFGGTATVSSAAVLVALPTEIIFEAVFEPLPGYTNAPTFTEFYITNAGELITPTGPASDIPVVYTAETGTLSITQTGLPAGTAWSVTVGGTVYTSTSGGMTNPIAPGTYSYTVGPVPGYAATPTSGSTTVSSDQITSVAIAFAPTTGWIAGTVTPSGATVQIDGVAVTTVGGAFNVSVPSGTHAIEVSASGYAPYDSLVTVIGGQTTHVPIVMTSLKPATFPAIDLYAIVGAILVLAVAILVAVLLTRKRQSGPPPTHVWDTPPAPPPPAPPSSGS
jgi:thermopsin